MNPSTTLVTRKAQAHDIDRLIKLRTWLLSHGEGHYVSQSPEEEIAWQESYRDWLLRNMETNDRILVAVLSEGEGSEIAACAIGVIDERAPMKGCLNGRVGWVQTVVVDPVHRRKGYGERVMTFVLDWFKSQQVGKVVLQTTPIAKPLYTKLGFFESGEEVLVKEIEA